jgi:hypothetical protein
VSHARRAGRGRVLLRGRRCSHSPGAVKCVPIADESCALDVRIGMCAHGAT